MAFFRQKPLTIEAMQIGIDAWPAEFWQAVCDQKISLHRCTDGKLYVLVEAPDGHIRGNFRDWLIRDVDGAYRVAAPTSFEMSYEAA